MTTDFNLLSDILKIIGIDVQYKIISENFDGEILQNILNDINVFMPDGGIIFLLMRQQEIVNKFLSIQENELKNKNYQIVLYDHYDTLEFRNNIYIYSLIPGEGKDFITKNNIMSILGYNHIIKTRELFFLMFFDIYHFLIKEMSEDDIDRLRLSIYNRKFETIFGDMILSEDNCFQFNRYFYRINEDNETQIFYKYGIHEAGHPLYSNFIDINQLECSYILDGKGYGFVNPSYYIIIVLYNNVDYIIENNIILSGYFASIFRINQKYGGIKGKYLKPIIVKYENVPQLLDYMDREIIKYSIDYIFCSSLYESLPELSEYASERGKVVFYINDFYGESVSQNNVIFGGFPLMDLVIINTHVQFINKNNEVFILYQNTNLYQTIINVLKVELGKKNLVIKGAISVNFVNNIWNNIFDMVENALNNGGTIFSMLNANLFKTFMRIYMKKYKDGEKYVVISYEIPDDVYVNSQNYLNHYFYQTAVENKTNESGITTEFMSEYLYFPLNMSHRCIHSINSVLIFNDIIRKTNTFKTNLFLKNIKHHFFEGPVGPSLCQNNNIISHQLSLLQLIKSDDGNLQLVKRYQYTQNENNNINIKNYLKTIKILVIIRKKQETENKIMDGIHMILYRVNNELDSKFNLVINYLYYSNNSYLAQVDFSTYENQGVTYFIGCDDTKCLKIVSSKIDGYGYLIYPFPIFGDECNKNVLFGGPTSYQMIRSISVLLDTLVFDYTVYFLLSKNDEWIKFAELIDPFCKDYLKYNGKLMKSDDSLFTIIDFRKVVDEISINGIIITTYNYHILIQFLQYLHTIVYSEDSYRIVSLRVLRSDVLESDLYLFSNVFFVSSLYPSESIKSSSYYVYMDEISKSSNSHDISYKVFILFGIIFNANELDINSNVKPSLSDLQSIRTEGYKHYLTESNYIRNTLYVTRINGTNEDLIVTTYFFPHVYNQLLNSEFGYICNVSEDKKIKVKTYKVVLMTSYTGINSHENIGLLSSILHAFNTYNEYNNDNIVPIAVDDRNIFRTARVLLREYFTAEILFMITTYDDFLLSSELGFIEAIQRPIIKIGSYSGELCSLYIFYSGTDPSRMNDIVDTSLSNDRKDFILIGGKDRYSETVINYGKELISKYSGKILLSGQFNSEEELMEAMVNDVSITEDSYIFVFFGNEVVFRSLLKLLNSYESDVIKFPLYSLTQQIEGEGLRDYYYYGDFLPSSVNDEFKREFQTYVSKQLKITEKIVDCFIWSKLFQQLDTNGEGINLLYNIIFDSPVDKVRVQQNNILNKKTMGGLFNSKENLLITLFEGTTRHINTFKKYLSEDNKMCNVLGYYGILVKKTAHVGLVLPLRGNLRFKGIEILSVFTLLIDELNTKDILMDSFVQVKMKDTESDLHILKSVLSEMTEMNEILAIFGGINGQEKKVISSVIEVTDKIFYFIGNDPGMNCYKKTISFGSNPHQLTLHILNIIIYKPAFYVIIYDGVDLSMNLQISLKSIFTLLHNPFIIIKDDIANSIMKNCIAKKCFIFNTLIGEISVDLVRGFIENGIIYPQYEIIHFYVDEFQLNENLPLFENHYIVGSFFHEFTHMFIKEFNEVSQFINSLKQFSYLHSNLNYDSSVINIYYALNFWVSTIKHSVSFDPTIVLENSMNKEFSGVMGNVKVNKNSFTSKKIYTVKIERGGYNLLDSPLLPQESETFSDWIPEQEGMYCKIDEKNNFVKAMRNNIIKIALILELDDNLRDIAYSTYYSFFNVIKNENKAGDEYLLLKLYFGVVNKENTNKNSDARPIQNIISEIMDDEGIKMVFACVDTECKSVLKEQSEKRKYLSFYLGNSIDNIISRYVVNYGVTVIQKWLITYEYLKPIYENYYIITNPGSIYINSIKEIEQMLKSSEDSNFIATIIPEDISRVFFSVRNIKKLLEKRTNLVGKINNKI